MLFYIICTTRKCSEKCCCKLFGVTGIFFILWSDYYGNLEYFHKKIWLICCTLEKPQLFLIKNEQHMQKLGITHSCYEMLLPRPIFSWAGQKDPGSIFFVTLQKISKSTKYFVCNLRSYYLRINRNHSSVIKNNTILQWFIYHPGKKWPSLCWWGIHRLIFHLV